MEKCGTWTTLIETSVVAVKEGLSSFVWIFEPLKISKMYFIILNISAYWNNLTMCVLVMKQ